jgi:hypothetical protein
MSEILDIKKRFEELQNKYQAYLPKVDPDLIHDLLTRQQENPQVTPIYMLEVFTKPGIDSQAARNYIFEKTGMVAAVYDHGTHYVTNQKLTLETLKEISNSEDVLEVAGEYTGGIGGWGPSHEHAGHRHTHDYYTSSSPQQQEQTEKQLPSIEKNILEEKKIYSSFNNHKLVIYTAIGIIGAIALAGYIISGGLLPNVNKGATLPPLPSQLPPRSLSSALQPLSRDIHGYVGGPGGLPAIGATVVAAEQETGYTVNSIVSVDGKYSFSLPPGKYIVMVAYPDGTNKKVTNLQVEQGTARNQDFKY